MRPLALPVAFFLLTIFLTGLPAQQDLPPEKSALQRSSKGWEDLPLHMKEWKRVSIPPKSKLAAKNPWRFEDGGVLVCNGVGVHEMLLYDKPLANGIFHVEWRFKKTGAASGYNSGIYVRTSANGSVWHQAQLGSKFGGYLFGTTLVDKKSVKMDPKKYQLPGPNRIKEAGEWNVTEVTFKDRTISVFNNGYITADWGLCEVGNGHIGLEAEGYYLEFKNLKYKRVR